MTVLGDKVATEVEAATANIQEIKAHTIEIILPKTNHGVEEGFTIPLGAWALETSFTILYCEGWCVWKTMCS